jgi:hypothetical protein
MKATGKFVATMLLATTAMFAVSCGGNAKKKAADGTTETAQTETKADAPKGGAAASMAAFTASDRENLTDQWIEDLVTYTGIKGIGKPQGSTVKESSRAMEHDSFIIRFTTDKPSATFAAYGKSVWDACKKGAEKGELFRYFGKNNDGSLAIFPLTFEEATSDDMCKWHYNFGGAMWSVEVFSDDENEIQLTVKKV